MAHPAYDRGNLYLQYTGWSKSRSCLDVFFLKVSAGDTFLVMFDIFGNLSTFWPSLHKKSKNDFWTILVQFMEFGISACGTQRSNYRAIHDFLRDNTLCFMLTFEIKVTKSFGNANLVFKIRPYVIQGRTIDGTRTIDSTHSNTGTQSCCFLQLCLS